MIGVLHKPEASVLLEVFYLFLFCFYLKTIMQC